MAVLFALAALILVAWLVTRRPRAEGAVPASSEQERIDRLIEALYKAGVQWGYRRAWAHQLEAEQHRVQAFLRRRGRTHLLATVGASLTAALPLGAALGIVPNQGAWLPALPQWQWLLLALAAALLFALLGALLAPRDYHAYSATATATQAELLRLRGELDELLGGSLAQQMNAAKAYMSAVTVEQFEAGLEQGRSERLRERGAARADDAALQARISSAANAAYVQGREDGAGEARGEVDRLLSEAYARGVGDGERAAHGQVEGRLRAEREDAYQAGYRAGLAEGRAARPTAAAPAGGGRGRPRTRLEALALLELTEGATRAEVEARYRELRAAVHPDAIRSKKLPRALVAFAEEQFKLVGEAYDILKR